jgi:hypothetical protein
MIRCASPSAVLLGAFDRFNYGDLLFPMVVGNELAVHSSGTITAVHALIGSDLRRYGAMETRSLKALYRPGALAPGTAVIFAGGGTIGVDWSAMYANLLGRTGNAALYYLQRLIGESAVNALSRRSFGGRAPFPWVAGPGDFPVPVNVAYNAVGGSEFARLPLRVQERTLNRLEQAAYLSVRDAETKRLFAPLESRLPVALAPDSAILMSEQCAIPWLETRASGALRVLLDAGPYLCFQSNQRYAQKHLDAIVVALEAIHEHSRLPAILLPMGRHVGLDDQLGLRTIQAKLRTPARVVSADASLFEIMLTIAKATLFIGTSLHGTITSQSFAVPHLGLSDRPCKVDFYLETWDLPGQSRCPALGEVPWRASEVLAIPAAARLTLRAELIARAHRNFAAMAQACGLGWN